MKNLKKIVLGLMLLLAVFAFVGCPTDVPEQKPSAGGNVEGGDEEGNQPADDEYIVMYNCEIFTSFSTLEEFEAFLSKLDKYDPDTDSGDYYFDDAFTVVLTEAGYKKLYDDNGEEILPANDFKGNVYVMSYEMLGESQITGYIEFTDDTDGKVVILSKNEETFEECLDELPFSYTVEDDVATITQIIEGETESFETSELVNGKFSYVEKDKETGLELKISCTKGDTSLFVKGSVFYGEEELVKDLYLVTYVNELVTYYVSEDEYSIKDGNIYLAQKGYDKAFGNWTFEGKTFEGFSGIYAVILSYGLEEGTDYTIDWDNLEVTLTEAGAAKIASDVWGLVYGEEVIVDGVPKSIMITQLEMYGLVEGDDYTIDSEEKAFILTDAGYEKIKGDAE